MLNLRNPVTAIPDLPGYAVAMADDGSLEVEVKKDQNLKSVFISCEFPIPTFFRSNQIQTSIKFVVHLDMGADRAWIKKFSDSFRIATRVSKKCTICKKN